MKNIVRNRRKPVEKSRHLSTSLIFKTMKKTLSITLLAAVLAAGSAFANQKRVITWILWEGTLVTGLASDIKIQYCLGGNRIVCAMDIDNGYNVIYRP